MIEDFCSPLEWLPNAVAEPFRPVLVAAVGALSAAFAKCEALFSDVANLFKLAEGVEQVEQARVGRSKAADQADRAAPLEARRSFSGFETVRARERQNRHGRVRVVRRGRSFAAVRWPSGPPTVVAACVGIGDNDGSGRKINARRNGRSRKKSIEQAARHHLFDQQFPRRNMTGVMCSDARTDDRLCVFMVGYLGKLERRIRRRSFDAAPGARGRLAAICRRRLLRPLRHIAAASAETRSPAGDRNYAVRQ